MLLAHLYYREFPNHLHKIKYKMAMDTKRQHTWKVNGRIKLFIAPCFVFAFPALILLTLLPIHWRSVKRLPRPWLLNTVYLEDYAETRDYRLPQPQACFN